MLAARSSMWLALGLLACHGPSADSALSSPDVVALTVAPYVDPIGGSLPTIHVDVTALHAATLRLEIDDEVGDAVWTHDDPVRQGASTVDESWNARDPSGAWAPAGRYTVLARLGDVAADAAPVALVRAAFASVVAGDDGGTASERIPMYWHESGDLQDPAAPISTISSLEDDAGDPRDLPEVSKGVGSKPGKAAEPVAYRWRDRPVLSLTNGESTVLGGSGLSAAIVDVSVPGWTVLSGSPVAPGVPVVIERDAALSTGLGVVDETLDVSFTATDAAGSTYEVAQQRVPMRFFATYGASAFEATGDEYAPWVAALDGALAGIQGTEADPAEIKDALVAWIFEDEGLTYDTQYGASAYTWYSSGFNGGHFQFSAYLARKNGDIVNCSDCASILSAYANMLGVPLDYTIILHDFSLGQIEAIGVDSFTNCPFGPSGCGFSYHAVTTDDDAATIWDATLALDGDLDPAHAPSTELLVQSITGEEYLDRLLAPGSSAGYYDTQQEKVQ
jgi:hypothetical protein